MIRQLFRSRKENREVRPTVRPMLETLEAREVPASIQAAVSAAFQELPGAVNGLQLAISTQNLSNGQAQFKIINNDINTLNNNASHFAQPSRQQIDVALFTNGFQLVQEGFGLFQLGDQADAISIRNLGITSIIGGYVDFLQAGGGFSNGNLQLQ